MKLVALILTAALSVATVVLAEEPSTDQNAEVSAAAQKVAEKSDVLFFVGGDVVREVVNIGGNCMNVAFGNTGRNTGMSDDSFQKCLELHFKYGKAVSAKLTPMEAAALISALTEWSETIGKDMNPDLKAGFPFYLGAISEITKAFLEATRSAHGVAGAPQAPPVPETGDEGNDDEDLPPTGDEDQIPSGGDDGDYDDGDYQVPDSDVQEEIQGLRSLLTLAAVGVIIIIVVLLVVVGYWFYARMQEQKLLSQHLS